MQCSKGNVAIGLCIKRGRCKKEARSSQPWDSVGRGVTEKWHLCHTVKFEQRSGKQRKKKTSEAQGVESISGSCPAQPTLLVYTSKTLGPFGSLVPLYWKKYTTIAKLRNPLASFPACKSDELAEKHVLEFLLPRASMRSPGLCALCDGKGIHPFGSPDTHLVNECWRYCKGTPVCLQQVLLEIGSLMQVPGCWGEKG